MEKSALGKPDAKGAVTAQDGLPASDSTQSSAASAATPHAGGAGQARQAGARGLSSMQHVVELADGLSTVADRLHERILREIRSHDGRGVPNQVQDAMRSLLDDEIVLRKRANTLYADAAAFVIQGLDQPQSRLVALTTDAAEKIRRIAVIGEATSLVGGLLSLAGAVASGHPTTIVLALEKIHRHSTALDTLTPPPPTATA